MDKSRPPLLHRLASSSVTRTERDYPRATIWSPSRMLSSSLLCFRMQAPTAKLLSKPQGRGYRGCSVWINRQNQQASQLRLSYRIKPTARA